jgi:hypothetical protein
MALLADLLLLSCRVVSSFLQPTQAQSVATQSSEVPAFLLGLTVGVFVTMVATIRFAKGASSS